MDEELPITSFEILACWIIAGTILVVTFITSCNQNYPTTICTEFEQQISSSSSVVPPTPDKDAVVDVQEETAIVTVNEVPVAARGKKAEHLYHPIIEQAADLYEVDPALVKAIIMAESSFNPRAVSKRGAMGLMQLMPITARALGVEDGFNPEHNINAGVKYFKRLLNQFDGDTRLALAAYNAGMTKVRQYEGVPPYDATHRYIEKVFEYYNYYKARVSKEIGEA